MAKLQKETNLALGFLRIAYKDYIAARVLLNKNYTFQGAVLASTAIEKYFKAAISLRMETVPPVHLDKFERIRKIVEEIGYGILFQKIDSRFFEILGQVYTLRYYDKISKPTTIGFFKNQFLGELDGAVELFERLFIIQNEKGESVLSPLKRDFKNKNPDLMENNWVTTTEKNKRLFMETNCVAFGIYINPDNIFQEINLSSVKMNMPYDGTMQLINMKDSSE